MDKNEDVISGYSLSQKEIYVWRTLQTLVWIAGILILFYLIFYPIIGIHLFWNILIPVAPALFVVAVGVWRNVCPMASNALFPRHMEFSKRKTLTTTQIGKLNLIGIIVLFIVVPLRHAIFDTNGLATAILILSLGVISIILGIFFDWKSAWCSGLCPVHPVEKLYGIKNRLSLPNAHCHECHRCVTPCPDTTPGITPLTKDKSKYHKISGLLMVGAFPGFIWGWFHVPDYNGIAGIEKIVDIYMFPFLGALISSFLYYISSKYFDKKILVSIFSATAVSFYYWYRIPALLGFGLFPGDGMLIDLTSTLTLFSMMAIQVTLALFFFYWLVFSKQKKISWVIRPYYADGVE